MQTVSATPKHGEVNAEGAELLVAYCLSLIGRFHTEQPTPTLRGRAAVGNDSISDKQ